MITGSAPKAVISVRLRTEPTITGGAAEDQGGLAFPPVGVTAHHLATALEPLSHMIETVAAGQAPGNLTVEMLDEMNAQHARDQNFEQAFVRRHLRKRQI